MELYIVNYAIDTYVGGEPQSLDELAKPSYKYICRPEDLEYRIEITKSQMIESYCWGDVKQMERLQYDWRQSSENSANVIHLVVGSAVVGIIHAIKEDV